jgi:hypothetical protein
MAQAERLIDHQRIVPVELTDDRRFNRRIVRLAVTSVVALGLVWWLARTTLVAPPAVSLGLLAGWLLMPVVLMLSLRRPRLRYALVVPSSLVTFALLAVCAWSLPEAAPARLGWMLTTAGILLGGLLGAWFWFRLLPVPLRLNDPFSPGRLTLVGVHIALIVVGLLLITLG